MIARVSLVVAVLSLASCSLFKKKDPYETAGYDTGNPYGVPGYDTAGSEAGAYTPEGGANPTYQPAAYEETSPAAPASAHAPAAPAANHGGGARVHTVGKGDTLWGIAKKYGVSVDSIKTANNLTKDTAVLGAKLKIPAR